MNNLKQEFYKARKLYRKYIKNKDYYNASYISDVMYHIKEKMELEMKEKRLNIVFEDGPETFEFKPENTTWSINLEKGQKLVVNKKECFVWNGEKLEELEKELKND